MGKLDLQVDTVLISRINKIRKKNKIFKLDKRADFELISWPAVGIRVSSDANWLLVSGGCS